MQETQVQNLGQEDTLEKEMATHSSILTWEIPWTEEPGELQSVESQKNQTWPRDWACMHVTKEIIIKASIISSNGNDSLKICEIFIHLFTHSFNKYWFNVTLYILGTAVDNKQKKPYKYLRCADVSQAL